MIDLFVSRFNHRLPLYVSPVPDPQAWAVDALSFPWSSLIGYAFPPLPLLGKVVKKARVDRATLILVAPFWPAQPWFPDLLVLNPLPRRSSSSSHRSQRSPSAPVRRSSQQPRVSQPSRLAAVWSSLSALGASPGVTRLILHAHRPSTQRVYASHWLRWARWCARHSVNPSAPTRMDMANFLAYLSGSLNLSSSSVRTYRSAISSTLAHMGPSFSVGSLLRGSELTRPRVTRQMPAWDLFLVLASFVALRMSHFTKLP